MKKIILMGAAAAALIATPIFAQQARGGFERGQGVTRAQVETRVRDMFARVDADRDGFVTQAEAQALRGATRGNRAERRQAREERKQDRFARLDANRDGSISREEFFARPDRGDRAGRREARAERRAERQALRAERRGNRGGFAARLGGGRLFERLDADRDGRVSLAEATRARLAAFDRADANRDGRVTREERRAIRGDRQGRRG
jgi:hypothetical protein